jgi:predicted Mrr-cat superfamily restriction endonuclease
MPRYWIIAPVESKPPDLFGKVWQFDLANNLISIGWKELGDVSRMSRDELSKAIARRYSDKPLQTKALYANMIWAFYHEITPGDFVVARRGRKTLAAVGKVSKSGFYAPGKNPAHGHPNFLEVSWQEQPREKSFPSIVFPMPTLAELSETQYQHLLDGSGVPPLSSEAPQGVEDANAFVLEK